ncbi:DUF1344 domain-containing protein [Chelativorans sp. J32]|uniref:DUF1344 domain-containing protein n=1 Tax=Chelativorans sp. J32 TaxID=935840 RepID=UPI000481650A|nr:DUF1344 domain-containing protein [Chelativorans sp. J32]
MRKLITAIGAATLLAVSALPGLAEEVTGVVQDINERGNTLKLQDGSEYVLPETFSPDTVKIGDTVVITYDQGEGGQKVATEVKAQR